MRFLFDMPLITPALGFIMRLCYELVQNVGVAIILFTIIVRIVMFPISLKQQKTMSKTQFFNPRIKEIQTKYRGNQQKQNEEMAKLQKEGYSPAGGCLPMLLTTLILFGVLGVVYKPMTYFEHIPKEQIEILKEIAIDIEYNKVLDAHTDDEEFGETAAENERKRIDTKYKALQSELLVIGSYKNNKTVYSESANVEKDTISTLNAIEGNITLFGIDFSRIPPLPWDSENKPVFPLVLIPILSFIFAMGQMLVTQTIQKKTSPETLEQQGTMKYMMYFMPVMSLVIAFQFPAGAGFYWALSSAVGILQSLIIYKLWPPAKLREEMLAELEKKGYKTDNVVVVEKHDGKKTTKKESEMTQSERKEYNRKKLEEARKADLEKYGEVGTTALSGEDNDSDESSEKDNSR
ncbi:MAG: YidC/Oxa1 family membrane protein insertase [Oscillospiraceae bacterium]|nr:YidC/Oxa1 family membrane protein insertase [Oscillospiraceae bacterium]